MKTKITVEISHKVLQEAQKITRTQHVTLKSLVEEGLRLAILKHQNQQTFHLRDVSFDGEGLSPEIEAAPWKNIRGLVYVSNLTL